jgi:hypothetical protein
VRTSSAFFCMESLESEVLKIPSVAGGFPKVLRGILSASFEVSSDPERGRLTRRTSCWGSLTYFSYPSPSHSGATTI